MKIIPKSGKLVIELKGWERVWSLKSQLVLDFAQVKSVRWNAGYPDSTNLRGVRLAGTSLPGNFYAGSFYRQKRQQFWYLKMKQKGELIIQTNLKKYHIIRLSVDQSVAESTLHWFNNYEEMRHIA